MSTDLLQIERDESTSRDAGTLAGCVTIRVGMPGQPVVVLDHPLIQRLESTLNEVRRMGGVTGLVVASTSERVFIAGADLKSISGLTDDQLDKYLAYGQRVFGMICDLPFPTAAAINGAALGGGLELAMHCDALIGAPPPAKDGAPGKPYPIGLPEASLSICPGWGGTNLLPARIEPGEGIRRTAEGKPMMFDAAAAAGLFDAVSPSPDTLLATAKAWIGARRESPTGEPTRDGAPSRWIGRPKQKPAATAAMFQLEETLPPTQATRAVLGAVRAGLEHGWQGCLDCERRELIRLRSTPDGKAAIKAFFDKAIAPRT
ncbi:MAG: enoyl-CoA hydratase/isomerase family protein [Phycisphaeraceae bacterium]|nr:enoyl-CoA hydratase/isomerase family protein [Phycisphaeraceae bacterium]